PPPLRAAASSAGGRKRFVAGSTRPFHGTLTLPGMRPGRPYELGPWPRNVSADRALTRQVDPFSVISRTSARLARSSGLGQAVNDAGEYALSPGSTRSSAAVQAASPPSSTL